MAEAQLEDKSTRDNVKLALEVLASDEKRLKRLRAYEAGEHERPYRPDTAGDEYDLLAERSITNITRLVVDSSAQALFVDNFAADGYDDGEADAPSPFWQHWIDSRMMQRQQPLWRAALTYGQACTLTLRDPRTVKVMTKGLSPFRSVPLFEDTTDIQPDAGLWVKRFPKGDVPGEARYFDWDYEHRVAWTKDSDLTVTRLGRHGAMRCPMTRFAPYVDLDGNASGVVEPLIPIQNRLNQTVFDLLIGQTHTAHIVRWATGIAPPFVMTTGEDGEPVPLLDERGNPVLDKQRAGASSFLFAEGADAKFGAIPAGDLSGLHAAVEGTLQVISAVGQVPPHFLLGKIANVNAEALNAAAAALSRKNSEIANVFAASVDRTMRVFGEIEGIDMAEGQVGQTVWRDLSVSSLAQTADALGKFAQMLQIPPQALWPRVPGVTRAELRDWTAAREDSEAITVFGQRQMDTIADLGASEESELPEAA